MVLRCFLLISDLDDSDMGYKPVHYRKVFLDDDDDDPAEKEGPRDEEEENYRASLNYRDTQDTSSQHEDEDYCGADHHYSDESYHYSDDHESCSDDSEHDANTRLQEIRD